MDAIVNVKLPEGIYRLSDVEILTTMIESEKRTEQLLYKGNCPYTALKSYQEAVYSVFYYSKARYEELMGVGSFYERNEYLHLFYDLALDLKGLPETVKKCASLYYHGTPHDTEIDAIFYARLCKEIKDEIERERAEQAEIERIKEETKELQRILGEQFPLQDLEKIKPLLKLAEHENRAGSYLFMAQLFNYGFIEGKRAERAKRKKSLYRLPTIQAQA